VADGAGPRAGSDATQGAGALEHEPRMRLSRTGDQRSVSGVNWTRGVRRSPTTKTLSRHRGGDGARLPVSGSARKGGGRISVGYVAGRICPVGVLTSLHGAQRGKCEP